MADESESKKRKGSGDTPFPLTYQEYYEQESRDRMISDMGTEVDNMDKLGEAEKWLKLSRAAFNTILQSRKVPTLDSLNYIKTGIDKYFNE